MAPDARITKSTNLLIKAGLALLNDNKDTKLTDIATHAGVGRATLYRLFSNKNELILAITQHCLEKYQQATLCIEQEAKSAMHALELLFIHAMPLTLEFKFLSNLDYFIDIGPEIKQTELQYKMEMMKLIDDIIKDVSVSKTLPASWLFNLIEGLFYAGWLQQIEDNYSPEQAAELAFYCFKKAIN